MQGIQAAAEQFPQAHILCPHFTCGTLYRMAERSLKRPPVFLSAKEIQSRRYKKSCIDYDERD